MTGAPGMVDVRTDGDHSVEHLSRTNVVASKISGESNRELPGLSPKNAEIAAAKTEASAATLSANPPPPSVEAGADASEISGNSTQNLPRQSPKTADIAATTTETSNVTPTDTQPPHTSVGANVDASEISGDSTQKLPGQSPNNVEMPFAITETTATPSDCHPPSTSVGSNVVASEISGDSTQKPSGQSPKNAEIAADTTETSTATPSADLAAPTSVSPPLADPTTSGPSLDSSQENPNYQGDNPDSEPESDQGDGFNEPKSPKYKVGTFIIKEVDNIWCTGVIHRVVFEKKSFLYSVKLNEVDIEESIMEDEIDQFVFSSDEWIVMKDLDVFVKIGITDHPAKIDSMVRLSDELVDTKSLRVRWVINNKKSEVDISSVRPMYTSEGDKKRRSVKPSKSDEQNVQSTTASPTQKSGDGLLEDSNCTRKLLVGLSYECKHYINCNSFFAKQKNAKMVEKSKRIQQEVVVFRDNFRLYQQEKSMKSSLSFRVMLTTGIELYKEEELIDSVMKECNRLAVKLSPQSNFVKCLCLMVYSCKNEESEAEVNMTEVPIVYGPLSSFIDRDDQVDLELACLSNMSVTIIFFPKHQNSPSPIEFHFRPF